MWQHVQLSKHIRSCDTQACCGDIKGRHGSDEFTKLLFESGYKFRVPLDSAVSVENVMTSKTITIQNFPCILRHCPVVLSSLKAGLVCTTVSPLKQQTNNSMTSSITEDAHPYHMSLHLSDALSVLQAYQNHKLPNLTKALRVAATRRAVLKWIPAHCGILGNEQADILAKEGARGEQHANNVSFSEKKTLIRALTKPELQRDDYHLLSRKQQVILVRLRTGHNRLNSHMHRKLKLAPSPTCPCGQEEQTTEHVLQRCPLTKLQEKTCGLSALP